MRKKLVAAAVVAGAAALVVSNPLVADAARLITSSDIANGTIQSRDIRNKSIKPIDIKPQGVKSWNIENQSILSRDIANEKILSKDIKNGTLQAEDFAAGQLPVAAYGRVTADSTNATLDTARTSNIASVTRLGEGRYCLELASGVDRGVAVLAQAEGNGAFATDEAAYSGLCGTNGVEISTHRMTLDGTTLTSAPKNDISFNVIVP
ncbi:MAG TPA: hypothetical protein VFY86_18770 [Nocardioides sp.]|nr:hypothetical protein [Nocardioides sp.]